VNTEFLMEILRSRGFGEVWISMIVTGGSVCVVANGEESGTFKTGKGLRQGTPSLPFFLI
jgi:hypothetical protein